MMSTAGIRKEKKSSRREARMHHRCTFFGSMTANDETKDMVRLVETNRLLADDVD